MMRSRLALSLMTLLLVALGASVAQAQSLQFTLNASNDHEYAHHVGIPDGFGDGEFTLEVWILPDDSYPVGTTAGGTEQLTNWSDADNEPYNTGTWWYAGNFLLDGHNNNACCGFEYGTFSLQFYGGGRVRWLFGDGISAGSGGVWSIGAFPATNSPTLLDGAWHELTLVRRWSGTSDSDLELWIDRTFIDSETSPVRTDMTTWWDSWPGFGAQAGWFWGAEKQAAIGVISQYEDYKGLVDEVRFWSRAKSPAEITQEFGAALTGNEPGLVGWFSFDEGTGASTCDALEPTLCMSMINAEPSIWSTEDAPIAAFVPALAPVGLGLLAGLIATSVRSRIRG